jgi:hypothetical protein
MRACHVTLLALLLLPDAAAAQVFHGPTPYLQAADSPFITTGNFQLDTFEDGALSTVGVTSVGGAPNPPSFITDSVDADDGAIDGFGLLGHTYFGGGAPGIRFDFSAAALGALPTQAGVVWTDGSTINTVTFEAFGPGGASLGTIVGPGIGDSDFFGGTGEDRFFGVTFAGGVSAIHIKCTPAAGATGTGIEVDHLQYGTPGPWKDLGFAKAGSQGTPHLTGTGPLTGGSPNQLVLMSAAPSAAATLVVGLTAVLAPFKGGTLVPQPLLLVPLPTNALGGMSLPFVLPGGLPAGTQLHFQHWIQDAGASAGYAASNGLRGTTG